MDLPDRYESTGDPLDGGMGTVLPCKDLTLQRDVAIKVIYGATHRRRMLDELSALAKMRSKHVVQVYDVLQPSRNEIGIVQEFISGVDLFDDAASPDDTTGLYKQLWQIASGINDIHALGVIHRDIKPNNMKIDGEGVVKIFDFGLARDEGPSAATLGFVGTRGFAAPELYVGPVRFTKAVDVYAFGATALYLATRELPDELMKQPPTFGGDSYFEDTHYDIADEIVEILDACLAEDSIDRPHMSTVRDLLAKHILHGRHRALVVFKGQPSYLNTDSDSVNLSLLPLGQVRIGYDGLDFKVVELTPEVFINNKRVAVGDILPGSCVVTLGAPEHKGRRRHITFDISHPEFVL